MNYFVELAETLIKLNAAPLVEFARACEGRLYIAGNGGSMATAQHWACDLLKAAVRDAYALGSNPAILTAFANDDSYERAYAYEFDRLVDPTRDRLICLSCSGKSDNIQYLLDRAMDRGVARALITGSAYDWPTHQPLVRIPHTHYGIIEDCFMALGHWLTEELRG